MKSEILYKESLNWLHEVQLFRKGLSQLNQALKESMAGADPPVTNEKICSLLGNIRDVNSNLSKTEERILESLNNGKMYWRGPNENLYCSSGEIKDNELLDLMKNNYNQLIELQRSINRFLNEQELS